MKNDADRIIEKSIQAVLPDEAVKKALEQMDLQGKIVLVAMGKAAWQMAKSAHQCLGDRIVRGVVVTKYDHSKGSIPSVEIFEGGHPIPDENGFAGTAAAIDAVSGLTEKDTVLFLVSGGGSALFEAPLISGTELADITAQMLACGADIVEMNTVRKRLSAVKGGRFAKLCEPAKVFSIVLSDIIGDPLDMIASGPAYPDSSTCEQAAAVVQKYNLRLSEKALELLRMETPKELTNVTTMVTGSVRAFCEAAADECERLGYKTTILTSYLTCEAREAGSFLASIAAQYVHTEIPLAFIAGGETVVHLTGSGKGGRNQELALAAAQGMAGMKNAALFSIGSDGTDGPTDAAGGYVDGSTQALLREKSLEISEVLHRNDAYNALKQCGGLIITGPTGTNVNDISVLLIRP